MVACLISLGMVFTMGIIFISAMVLEDVDYHPIVNFRKKHTPPCSKCVHYHNNGAYRNNIECTCPQAIENYEKEYLRIVETVEASKVRGTKGCKFKSTEPKPAKSKPAKGKDTSSDNKECF